MIPPLVNCILNDAIVKCQAKRSATTLLLFVNVVTGELINLLLDESPYFVVDQIEVVAVRWPQIRSNERGVACLKNHIRYSVAYQCAGRC